MARSIAQTGVMPSCELIFRLLLAHALGLPARCVQMGLQSGASTVATFLMVLAAFAGGEPGPVLDSLSWGLHAEPRLP